MSENGWNTGTCGLTHDLDRTDFRCSGCGGPWPCPPARVQLGERYAQNPSELAAMMLDHMFDAIAAFAAPPRELYERFIAWTQYPRLPVPSAFACTRGRDRQ